jgi:hypothetical protein
MMYTLMLEELLAVATAALSSRDTNTLCSIANFSRKSCLHHQCDLVLSNYSNYKHAQHLCGAYIDAGTITSGSYRSTVEW